MAKDRTYMLSRYVPVPMKSTYEVVGQRRRERCVWIQWRGRVFFPQRSVVEEW